MQTDKIRTTWRDVCPQPTADQDWFLWFQPWFNIDQQLGNVWTRQQTEIIQIKITLSFFYVGIPIIVPCIKTSFHLVTFYLLISWFNHKGKDKIYFYFCKSNSNGACSTTNVQDNIVRFQAAPFSNLFIQKSSSHIVNWKRKGRNKSVSGYMTFNTWFQKAAMSMWKFSKKSEGPYLMAHKRLPHPPGIGTVNISMQSS